MNKEFTGDDLRKMTHREFEEKYLGFDTREPDHYMDYMMNYGKSNEPVIEPLAPPPVDGVCADPLCHQCENPDSVQQELKPCGFPVGYCLVPQPKISVCRQCGLKLVDTESCSACYYRKMAALYGARMKYFEECLKHIATYEGDVSAEDIENYAREKLVFYGHFNLQEIYSDSFLILTETARLFSLIVAHEIEFPPELEREVVSMLDVTKGMVVKYSTLKGEK